MAIARPDSLVTTVKRQVVTNEDNKPINMDNSTIIDGYAGNEIERYAKYIDGLRMDVDYYSFVRGSNTENVLLDPNDDSQQYIKIKQLELTLLSPIVVGNYNDVNFDAIIDAGLVPAENDIIVFRLFNGKLGMFRVTDIIKRNYIARKIYDVKVMFLYFEDSNPDYFNSLFSKIVKNYVYDKNYISTNSAPIILEPTYKKKLNTINNFNSILDSYLKMFTSERVLAYKDDEMVMFDSSIQKLVLTLIDEQRYKMLKIVESDYEDDTIVDDILGKTGTIAPRNDYYELVDVKFDIGLDRAISLSSALVTKSVFMSTTPSTNPFRDLGLAGSTIIPDNFRTSSSNLYLFSTMFYNDEHNGIDELSVLESMILKYLDNEVLDSSILTRVIENMNEWTKIEIFYYTPFLLLLLKHSTLNTYDRI